MNTVASLPAKLLVLADRVENLLTAWGESDEREDRDNIAAELREAAAALATPAVEGASSAGEAVGFLLDGRDSTDDPWEALPGMYPMHELHHFECRPQTFRVRAFLCAATPPPPPAAFNTDADASHTQGGVEQAPAAEQDKAARDALIYGSGYMVGGKHVPVDQVSITLPPKPEARGVEGMRNALEEIATVAHSDQSESDLETVLAWLASIVDPLLAATPNPVRAEQPEGKGAFGLALRLLVAAGHVTEAKANEALCIAHGFEPGPLAPAAPVGVEEIRRAVADHMWSDDEKHERKLAELLGVPRFDDDSGFDFRRFRTGALAGKDGA